MFFFQSWHLNRWCSPNSENDGGSNNSFYWLLLSISWAWPWALSFMGLKIYFLNLIIERKSAGRNLSQTASDWAALLNREETVDKVQASPGVVNDSTSDMQPSGNTEMSASRLASIDS